MEEIKDLNDKSENNEKKMQLLYKKVEIEDEEMPYLPEGLIRFPTLEELKAFSKTEPEANDISKESLLNDEPQKKEGEIPGLEINGPKIESGIDIKEPKLGDPEIRIEIQLPDINADMEMIPPKLQLRGPKPKKENKKL